MQRIQKASRRLRGILLAIICLLPVIDALVWIYMNTFPEMIWRKMLPHFTIMPLPASARFMGFVATMLPTGVAMLGGYHLMRLFRLYGLGQIFRESNVRCFRTLSRILIWWFAAGIIQESLLGIALTLHNPPGQRIITFGLGSPDLTALLLGGILAVVAWVMEEGRKLQEDQDLTV